MSNPYSYEGKRVVITGAYSGVGAALLELVSELGAEHITVLDVKEPDGPATVFLETDLSDRGAVDAAVGAIEGPVHALFNNAGVAATLPPTTVMAVNYLALRRLSEGLLDKIPAGGAIANTASIAGGQWPQRIAEINELLDIGDWDASLEWVTAHPETVTDPYSFSKEVVQVWTMRSSRATMARDVRTNSVCPAPIDTPLLVDFRATMTDKLIDWTVEQANGRLATPLDVARSLAFLGSDAASYVNGTNLLVDAGFTAAMTTGQVDLSALA
ncbi:MAG TPA: coniferyl-alcohol dehydrogenase [Acidimicrobiia bacterium]|nr:coniferyl-alcohol dehydrogenase [Acidimicrobiia bacterium]